MKNNKTIQGIYQQIRKILIQARSRALQAVNTEMVACYWEIGRLIVEEEQQGAKRAVYGKRLIIELSTRLSAEFGRGFDKSNLWNLRAFFVCFPKIDALRRELSWTHYRQQIFASRYKLYLPTEEELAAEIIKERQTIEMERRLSGKDSKT